VLSPEALAALLPSKTLGQSLFVFEELPSTNTFALELARNSTPQGTIVLADRQTAGRGRLQRSWFSPPEANIYGSVIFSLKTKFQSIGWIPLMAGTAIAQAIENHTTIDITLKWPNDILIAERKVGGILCESFNRDSTETRVVIGFGINVNLPESSFPKELQPIATSLQIHAQQTVDRHHLITSIITTLEQGWADLISRGPQSCQVAYRARCSTIGSHIQVHLPDGRQLDGLAKAIDEQGRLQMLLSSSDPKEQSAKMVNIHAGDIHHIRKSDIR